MKELLQKTKMGIPEEMLQAPENVKEVVKVKKQKAPVPVRPEEAVFVFDSLFAVMEYAAVLPANLRVASALYCMKEQYFLYLKKGNASYERYSRACIQAMEFAALYTADRDRMLHLQEHGECLIAEQAIKKLRIVNG